ncbi:hypothetical protein ACFLY6_01975 [Candidatus Dependentiae bacterium]
MILLRVVSVIVGFATGFVYAYSIRRSSDALRTQLKNQGGDGDKGGIGGVYVRDSLIRICVLVPSIFLLIWFAGLSMLFLLLGMLAAFVFFGITSLRRSDEDTHI